jgi:hypothetical protein
MQRLTVTTVGAWSAVLALPLLVAGAALLSSSGVPSLIPESGSAGRDWLYDVASTPQPFAAGGWLIILMGLLVLVAYVGFYDVLREAGPVLVLAPVLGVAAMTLVTVSHLVPIAMAYELAPAYAGADASQQAALGAVSDTLAATSQVVNATGNALGWGVVVPLYAWAVLSTRVLPHWIGWLGLVVAVLAGWLGLLAPASSAVEGVSNVGFVVFFVFLLSMGIAILRRHSGQRHRRTAAVLTS